MMEPTIDDLQWRMTVAVKCCGIPGADVSTINALYEARKSKTTWANKYECNFRYAIDRYLASRGRAVMTPDDDD